MKHDADAKKKLNMLVRDALSSIDVSEEPLLEVVGMGMKLRWVTAQNIGLNAARQLVDDYYAIQDFRIQAGAQVRSLSEYEEPCYMAAWLYAQMKGLESEIKKVLDSWTDRKPVAAWAKSIVGVGPVISAGLAAHIRIENAPCPSSVWRYAGLDPTVVWEKGQKRPWNAKLKCLTAFKLGESFVKVQSREGDVYGKLYAEKKADYAARNAAGDYRETAAWKLREKSYGKDTEAYKSLSAGRLPQAEIHAMGRRYAVKIFLSHYHTVAYWLEYNRLPAAPYAMEHLGHVHYIAIPNADMIPGLNEALRATGRK